MIWALVILTVIFAATALALVLWPLLNGRPAPVKRIPLVQPYAGRHVATERIHAGGRYTARMPRRDAPPLTEQSIIVQRPGRPWETAANPVLADEPLPSAAQLRNEYFRWRHPMPDFSKRGEQDKRGDWGTKSEADVLAAELPQVIA